MNILTIDTVEEIARLATESANEERNRAGLSPVHISSFVARHILAAAISAGIVVIVPEESEAK